LLLAGCVVGRRHRGESAAAVPALPPVVVLASEPYYVHQGYYSHYRNDGWYYSRTERGPWAPLPRERYPREVRFEDGAPGRHDGRDPGRR
jgi:hypothetical protein